MKKLLSIIILLTIVNISNAQDSKISAYYNYSKIADTSFFKKDFKKAIEFYNLAILNNDNQGKVIHRYRLANCYAKVINYDKAFEQLYRVATKGNFSKTDILKYDEAFIPMHEDERWDRLIKIVENNEEINSKKQ